MLRRKRGKLLGGKPPRRAGRWTRPPGEPSRRAPSQALGLLGMLSLGMFVIGVVAGFAWSMDQQLRAGLLSQHGELRQRRDWVDLEMLPAHVPNAFLAVVDPSFLRSGSLRTGEDGTTLPRELARQVHLLPPTVWGEAREMIMGPVLEQHASKQELLELYLNRVYLGQAQGYPVYGIHHAAREYFDKEAPQLTLGETATLAGLLLEPRITDPEGEVGAVGARRNEVLRVMLLGQLITPEQYRQALAEPLAFQPGLDEFPMTRPRDWGRTEVIRLPENLRPRPDSVPASPAAG